MNNSGEVKILIRPVGLINNRPFDVLMGQAGANKPGDVLLLVGTDGVADNGLPRAISTIALKCLVEGAIEVVDPSGY